MTKPILLIISVTLFLFSCSPQVRPVQRTDGPDIRVHLASITAMDSVTFSGTFILKSNEASYELGARNRTVYVQATTSGFRVYNKNRNWEYNSKDIIRFEPAEPSGRIQYGGYEYAGQLFIQRDSAGKLYLINKLPMETYLKGVVPYEIPSGDEAQFQAVKAQAVCARTYALNRLQNPASAYFDIYSTVADQVYHGEGTGHNLADKAVEETFGIVLKFQGKPASVFYHSTCGGRLEAAQTVWPDRGAPYLKPGVDGIGAEFACSVSPHFRWVETRTAGQLDTLFQKYYKKGYLTGAVKDTIKLNFRIHDVQRSLSGRIRELKITYADTTVSLAGFEIRRFFGWPAESSLRSTLIFFEQPKDSLLEIHGAGYGHGVGMCQWGAVGMARKGLKYYHILRKYFPETILANQY